MSPHLLRWRRRTCTQLARAARNAGLKHRALLILPAAPYPHCESGRFSASTLLPRKSRQGGIRLTADRPAGVTLAGLWMGAVAWLPIIGVFPDRKSSVSSSSLLQGRRRGLRSVNAGTFLPASLVWCPLHVE